MSTESCFVYIHTASIMGKEICKVGITNNLHKRLNEFNNSLRHLQRWHPEIAGAHFEQFFNYPTTCRGSAQKIEKIAKIILAEFIVPEFGKEVFMVDKATIRNIIVTAGKVGK